MILVPFFQMSHVHPMQCYMCVLDQRLLREFWFIARSGPCCRRDCVDRLDSRLVLNHPTTTRMGIRSRGEMSCSHALHLFAGRILDARGRRDGYCVEENDDYRANQAETEKTRKHGTNPSINEGDEAVEIAEKKFE